MAEDLLRMQQEAARRVRRMQEHSRQVFEEHQGRSPESLAAARRPVMPTPPSPSLYQSASTVSVMPEPPAKVPEPPAAPAAPAGAENPPRTGEAQDDPTRWMLVGLAYLLSREECRPELIAALLYLAM